MAQQRYRFRYDYDQIDKLINMGFTTRQIADIVNGPMSSLTEIVNKLKMRKQLKEKENEQIRLCKI